MRPASGSRPYPTLPWRSTSRSSRTCTAGSRRVLPISTSADVAAKTRLDVELVRRGLARSREHAQDLVATGRVRVGGLVATKSASGVDGGTSVTVTEPTGPEWVSRGALKLAGALDASTAATGAAPTVMHRRCLDAGASTGGFTQVLL